VGSLRRFGGEGEGREENREEVQSCSETLGGGEPRGREGKWPGFSKRLVASRGCGDTGPGGDELSGDAQSLSCLFCEERNGGKKGSRGLSEKRKKEEPSRQSK